LTPIAKSAQFEWDFEREALYLAEANPSALSDLLMQWMGPLCCSPTIPTLVLFGVTETRNISLGICSCLASTIG